MSVYKKISKFVLFWSVGLASVSACDSVDSVNGQGKFLDEDRSPPLADLDVLMEGVPDPDTIPRLDLKADSLLASQHFGLLDSMSPVKSQGGRGVCSIFSTIALMEHLYIKEGTIANPDFSEQYLQWSAKFEVGSFPFSSGSNAYYNLQSIRNYGIVAEAAWPYESNEWSDVDDVECTGEDDQPTKCHTNGHPTDAIKQALRFSLPSNRGLNPYDIKNHILNEGTGVVVGFTFFYQAWNHRKSELPTNDSNWSQGLVLYPNQKDKEVSLEKRAGHSILIIGWDDTLEAPVLDENGEPVVDPAGNPVMEKGFYLFKNSWGTDSFGVENPHGAGYGFISQRYMHEYGNARVSWLPQNVFVPQEICEDGFDNNFDGASDCDDVQCEGLPSCENIEVGGLNFVGAGGLIPDVDESGFVSSVTVAPEGKITSLYLDIDVAHSYRGDLKVLLQKEGQSVVVVNREGGSADNIIESYKLDDFIGAELSGEWTLTVVDEAAQDTGSVNAWSLTAQVE